MSAPLPREIGPQDPVPLAEAVRNRLTHDPVTGVFRWRKTQGNAVAHSIAGTLLQTGYISITINYRKHLAHRLAWLMVHGELPAGDLDHINGRRADNRIVNLRLATRSQNTANAGAHVDSSSGLKGIYPTSRKRNPWGARICVDGKRIPLGVFRTPEEAHAAYVAAAALYFRGFARSER